MTSIIERLSAREQEIARLVAMGHCNKIIAHRLSLAEPTVKVHMRSIFRALGTTSRTQVAVLLLTGERRWAM